ncbi:hypothetical protein HY417_02785 [Candidatus Kaiserbacteria bacterium]|nr:hypothetical protein [Candidatus Kaiserbacteria bacterium]
MNVSYAQSALTPFLLGILVTIIVFGAATTKAQSTLDLIFGADLAIDVSPAHPTPGERVLAKVHSTLIDLSATELTWSVNGKTIAAGIGITDVDVAAGKLGSEMRLTVTALEAGLEFASAEAFIRPVELDLVWESDSYTPPFYRGRALPSAETNLRLETIPRFIRSDGSSVATRDLIFTWKRGGYVMQSVSGRGKSTAVIESPSLFGADTISVEVKTSDGTLVGERSVRIASRTPHIALYQIHPVLGITYHRAFLEENLIPETEATFSAAPYFAEARHADDSTLRYQWKIHGIEIQNDEARPSTITINAENSSGEALVELFLTHATNLFLDTTDSWNFIFNSRDAGTPFQQPLSP